MRKPFIPCNRSKRLVNDLRDYQPPGPVKVYYLRKDGTRGHLIRTEANVAIQKPFGGMFNYKNDKRHS